MQLLGLYAHLATSYPDQLGAWCLQHYRGNNSFQQSEGAKLLKDLFHYDPDQRITAAEALQHKWFDEEPKPSAKYAPPPLACNPLTDG